MKKLKLARGRSWGVLLFAAITTLVSGAVIAFAGNALFSGPGSAQATADQGVQCDLYPIAIPYSVVGNATPGMLIDRMPRGTGAGNFSWLTWTGHPSAPTLANSLVPPGNAGNYVNPDQPNDHRLDIGDWAQGAPGSMNAKQVRDNLQQLLHQDIVVPAYDAVRGQGNQFDYRTERFAVIRLRGFQLTGQGWLSFEFAGFKRCHNLPPVAIDQNLQTPEDTAVSIVLSATDSQNDALSYAIASQPQHGTLSGTTPHLVYTPHADYNGPDQFTFTANDGMFDSAPGVVRIQVMPVNDPPHFTSTPLLEAIANQPYHYQATATDKETAAA